MNIIGKLDSHYDNERVVDAGFVNLIAEYWPAISIALHTAYKYDDRPDVVAVLEPLFKEKP